MSTNPTETPEGALNDGVRRALSVAKVNGRLDCQPVIDCLNRWGSIYAERFEVAPRHRKETPC